MALTMKYWYVPIFFTVGWILYDWLPRQVIRRTAKRYCHMDLSHNFRPIGYPVIYTWDGFTTTPHSYAEFARRTLLHLWQHETWTMFFQQHGFDHTIEERFCLVHRHWRIGVDSTSVMIRLIDHADYELSVPLDTSPLSLPRRRAADIFRIADKYQSLDTLRLAYADQLQTAIIEGPLPPGSDLARELLARIQIRMGTTPSLDMFDTVKEMAQTILNDAREKIAVS